MHMPINLGQLFEAVVSKHVNADVLAYADGRKIKYSTLNDTADKITLYYESVGLDKGDVLLLSGDKSPLMFAAIVAALKMGIIYSIFDPDMPGARLKKVIQVCEPTLLIGSLDEHFAIASECGVQTVPFATLENKPHLPRLVHANSKSEQPCEHDIAYIIFTSGSTGTPKGATMTHSNVISLIKWSLEEFSFGPGEILTNLNPCYFDNFVFDFYSSFFSGATLAPFTKNELLNPSQLIKAIETLGCTSWFSVPSTLIYLNTMKVFSMVKFRSLRRIIFGGEGYPKSKLLELYNKYKTHVAFYNVYGPSESTCIASCYRVSDDDFLEIDGFLPIGTLISGFSYFIVNNALELVPSGEMGELCLIGNGVGLGYFGQPDLTRASFIPKEKIVGQKGKELVYLTGDLVSYSAHDKYIYIFGRKDHQIKHMGYRIELEDIENALMRLPYVAQACCTHHSKNGISRLTAFVSTSTKLTVIQVKENLSELLPNYMIPTTFSFIDDIPKNKNGKMDRLKLMHMAELL